MSHKIIFTFVILLQICVIGFLFIIIKDKNDIQRRVSINPIEKETIIKIDSSLTHFFESKANTVIVEDGSFPATYTINSDSLNERFDYKIQKPSNVYRIITLGDSFTYGQYVDTKNNWVELLEDQLNTKACQNNKKFEVINLGFHGDDIQYAVERFKNRGAKYDPDLILWLLKTDDVFQINEIMLSKEVYYRELMKKTGEYQEEVDKGNLYPSWQRAMQEVTSEYGEEQILNIQKGHLNVFKDMYKNKLLVISFEHESENLRQFLKEFSVKDQHSYYYDSLPTIYNSEQLFYKNDNHPTAKGHQVISQNMYEYIIKNKLITCD